jgi:DNA-binding GntR family transcriptional regulator
MGKRDSISISRFPHPLPKRDFGKSLYLCVYDAIHDAILNVDTPWPAGTLLPGEQELAEYWEVSKGTIREALYHLLEDGVVQKAQGRRTIVSQTATWQHFSYQNLVNPVQTFCTRDLEPPKVEFQCVGASDWLAKTLNLSQGSVLVKGTLQYRKGKSHHATTVFFTPFSLLEKEQVRVDEPQAIIDFIERTVYDSADYSRSSICLIDEMEDNELPTIPLPLLLLEEFLYSKEQCYIFLRHYLHKSWFRIQTLRRRV